MKKVLSGIQPSGRLHLGNYLGMMSKMIEYQNKDELYCFIVNYHALTTVFDGKKLQENTLSAAADFLSLGLDPEKTTFWVQSDVPEVLELTWYLNNVSPYGLLERATSFKDKIDKGIPPNMGLFSYPVLMAADILLFQADKVPVGRDQKQHLEMARDIAIKFNHLYGETFTIPEPEIEMETSLVPGIDGQKMSKSYDNTLEIFLSGKKLKKKIMGIKTDSKGVDDPKDPTNCLVYQIYKLLASTDKVIEMSQKLSAGGYGYGDAKKELLNIFNETFEPFREKKERWMSDSDSIRDIMRQGAKKARAKAAPTLEMVRQKVGVIY